jgi:DNA-binding response OmpR family regulator
MRLLVVEDEVDIADAVAAGLRRHGYAVDVSYDGNDALEKISYTEYDLLVLDINLPGVDGRTLARRVRSGKDVPGEQPRILMLTAKGTVEDRVGGLDDGADDYVVKPFSLEELSARVRALLRRDRSPTSSVIEVGPLRLDDRRHEVTHKGETLDLTAKEFALLRYFMSRAGEVLSQEDLLEHVWDEHADPFTKTVRVTVMNLRRKLETAGIERPIETVVGRGYRLKD